MKTTIVVLFIFMACAPSSQREVLVKDEVIAECEAMNPHAYGESAVYVFECYGVKEDGSSFHVTLDIPIAEYPPMWAAPGMRRYHGLGRSSDGKLHFLKTPATACDDEHPASRFQKPNINGCEGRFKRE